MATWKLTCVRNGLYTELLSRADDQDILQVLSVMMRHYADAQYLITRLPDEPVTPEAPQPFLP